MALSLGYHTKLPYLDHLGGIFGPISRLPHQQITRAISDAVSTRCAINIMTCFEISGIGMFAFGQRTGMLDDPPSDKGIKFRDTIKNVLSLSMFFSIFKWSKYVYRSKHKLLADSLTGYTQHAEHLVRNVIKHVLDCEERDVPIDRRYGMFLFYIYLSAVKIYHREQFFSLILVIYF